MIGLFAEMVLEILFYRSSQSFKISLLGDNFQNSYCFVCVVLTSQVGGSDMLLVAIGLYIRRLVHWNAM